MELSNISVRQASSGAFIASHQISPCPLRSLNPSHTSSVSRQQVPILTASYRVIQGSAHATWAEPIK
jgi:hypothetical protein